MVRVTIRHVDFSLSEEYFEGIITFVLNGKEYSAFSYGVRYVEGEEVNVEFDCLTGMESLKEIINGNPLKKKELIQKNKWSYDGYGEIVSIDPVVADFGNGIRLEIGNHLKNPKLIGSYIYREIIRLDIERLDIYSSIKK
jgi:hypothetical protein